MESTTHINPRSFSIMATSKLCNRINKFKYFYGKRDTGMELIMYRKKELQIKRPVNPIKLCLCVLSSEVNKKSYAQKRIKNYNRIMVMQV